jgi:hypothetical protein
MENLLVSSDLTQKKCQNSMMNATMDVIEITEVDVLVDPNSEIRKSNLRDYLEIFGYMDDTL